MRAAHNAARLAFQNPHLQSRVSMRQLSIEHRGKPISREDLFKHTSGQFLIGEKTELSNRPVHFDLDQLCNVVAGIDGSGARHVSRIEKLDSKVNRVLLMTTSDNCEYVAKIPCPGIGRPMYSTASEVAVMDFVKRNTQLPVPKVLAWSADASNAVGAEYLVMEKAPGVQLSKKWNEMTEDHRLIIIKNLVRWESQLARIDFDAYGSIYYKNSLKESEDSVQLRGFQDPRSEFRIGPSCDPDWHGPHIDPNIYRGPWKKLKDLGVALIDRSLSTAAHHPNPKVPVHLQRSWEEYAHNLNTAKRIMPVVTRHLSLVVHDDARLWHPNLDWEHIFVSENIPGKITSFIGWRHSTLSPGFCAPFPAFLKESLKGYEWGRQSNSKPSSSSGEPSSNNQEALGAEEVQAKAAQVYMEATSVFNKKTAQAIKQTLPFKDLLLHCGGTWDKGVLPLRQTLIEFYKSPRVPGIGFREGQLDLDFTDEQIAQHNEEFRLHQEWIDIRNFVKSKLGTDDDGWVTPERDVEEMKRMNDRLFAEQRDSQFSELKKTDAEIRRLWPFDLSENIQHY